MIRHWWRYRLSRGPDDPPRARDGLAHASCVEIDVLGCPRCGGCLRLIAIVEDPGAIRAIVADLELRADLLDRAPPSMVQTAPAVRSA